jgi:hypothetical protein
MLAGIPMFLQNYKVFLKKIRKQQPVNSHSSVSEEGVVRVKLEAFLSF